jgi:hypothetical protein
MLFAKKQEFMNARKRISSKKKAVNRPIQSHSEPRSVERKHEIKIFVAFHESQSA